MIILDNGKGISSFAMPKGKKYKPKTLVKPDSVYEVGRWNDGAEIYEFTPRSNKDWTCTAYLLESLKDISMSCFPKQTPVKN